MHFFGCVVVGQRNVFFRSLSMIRIYLIALSIILFSSLAIGKEYGNYEPKRIRAPSEAWCVLQGASPNIGAKGAVSDLCFQL
jgi:hypothetical protein